MSGPGAAAGAPTAASQMAGDQAFKNVTVLNAFPSTSHGHWALSPRRLLGEDCHTASSNDWANYAKDVSPRKTMARQMVTMMQGVNKQYFGGRQVVTCFTCHRGSNRPKVTASLDILYGTPPPDELDVLVLPGAAGGPTAVQILDKYLAAVGGAQRAAALTSFVAKGMYPVTVGASRGRSRLRPGPPETPRRGPPPATTHHVQRHGPVGLGPFKPMTSSAARR